MTQTNAVHAASNQPRVKLISQKEAVAVVVVVVVVVVEEAVVDVAAEALKNLNAVIALMPGMSGPEMAHAWKYIPHITLIHRNGTTYLIMFAMTYLNAAVPIRDNE